MARGLWRPPTTHVQAKALSAALEDADISR